MKNKSIPFGVVFWTITLLFAWSCTDEVERPEFPLSAEVFHSVDGKQVAFTALTHSATSWAWDFGDGGTSTEKNPVYIYEEGGYFVATLTATDAAGNSELSEVKLAIELTPYALLTGDQTAEGYAGKTWKLTANHPAEDRLANADADFSIADGAPEVLPQGAFDLFLDMGEVYNDTYTFFNDGSYGHDVKEDEAAFSGLLFQMLVSGGTGSTIRNMGGQDFGLCTGIYTPQENATFTYVANENFEVPSVYGSGGVLTYENVSTLNFSGNEFVGFMDFQRKVLLKNITDNSMQLVMFIALSQDHAPLNTHALVLTFEVVK